MTLRLTPAEACRQRFTGLGIVDSKSLSAMAESADDGSAVLISVVRTTGTEMTSSSRKSVRTLLMRYRRMAASGRVVDDGNGINQLRNVPATLIANYREYWNPMAFTAAMAELASTTPPNERSVFMTRRRMSRATAGSPSAIPASMKAAAIDRFGPPSMLTLHDVPVPTPGPHEVLIAIETAGIGSWDASIRDGSLRQPGRPRFPLVPGVDGAGVVVAKGARVRRFRLGDHVYAYEFGNRQGGFYAEFAAADAAHVARIAKGLDLRDAGAVATTGLTALQGLDALELRPGHTVLIFGASRRCRHNGGAVRRSTRARTSSRPHPAPRPHVSFERSALIA